MLDPKFFLWTFQQTQIISSYLFAIVAGNYVEIKNEAKDLAIPQSLYVRQAQLEYIQRDYKKIFELLNTAISFVEGFIKSKYPYSKYDQVFCPEYNVGAMVLSILGKPGPGDLHGQLPHERGGHGLLRHESREHHRPRNGAHVVRRLGTC